MTQTRTAADWEQRYCINDLPWDARRPEARLFEVLADLTPPTATALDLGCGGGDNAIALAQRGFDVVGIDLAPTAIDLARSRAKEAGVQKVRFVCGSVLEPLPVAPGSLGLAIDCGCFHTLPPSDRPTYAQRVAGALTPGAWLLLMCGNIDEPRPASQEGPPQLTATQIAAPLEPHFALHRLERTHFTGSDGRPTHLAWRALFQLRQLAI
ncbi:MAG: methyltransferase domain-containing protein [Phycisphaeraceae bacterium]